MIGQYRACPFGGIVCIECKVPLPDLKKGYVVSLTYHEQLPCHQSSCRLSIDENKAVVASCSAELERIAFAMTQCINKDEACSMLKQYLSKETMFPFCEVCNVCIATKRNHTKAHYKKCHSQWLGYSVTNWVKKSPKIVPHPLDIELESNFSPLYWKFVIRAKTFHMTTNQNPVRTTKNDTNRQQLTVSDIDNQFCSFIKERIETIQTKIQSETSLQVISDSPSYYSTVGIGHGPM
jgi:hypothetical protein